MFRRELLLLFNARLVVGAFIGAGTASSPCRLSQSTAAPQLDVRMGDPGALGLDLTGKVAFVAGVADSTGYGWAICKALASRAPQLPSARGHRSRHLREILRASKFGGP